MSSSRTPLLLVAATLFGGIAGAAVNLSLSSNESPVRGDGTPESSPEALLERVASLEARIERAAQAEARTARPRRRASEAAGDAQSTPSADEQTEATDAAARGSAPQFDDLGLPLPEESFLARVSAAITELDRRKKERQLREQLVQRRDGFLANIKKQYANYREPLELSPDELARINAMATTYVDERLGMQADGAEQSELLERDREARRAIRDILGADRYRKLRGLELDRVARPVIVDAATKAGVDARQRKQIETLLSEHIERIVDNDVRLRTDEVEPQERQRIQQEMNTANRDAWDRLRNEILTDEQRGRVPERR